MSRSDMYHFLVETLRISAQSPMSFSIDVAIVKEYIKKTLVAWIPEGAEE